MLNLKTFFQPQATSLLLLATLFSTLALHAKNHSLKENKNFNVQKLSNALSSHQDTFIATGSPNTKVQLSFKSQLNKHQEWPLDFAYTQLMLWEVSSESSPFVEINYNPQLTYGIPSEWGFLTRVDLGLIDHLSNGQGGPESRSRDQVHIAAHFEAYHPLVHSNLRLQANNLYNLDSQNSDLQKYIGFWESRLTLKPQQTLWPKDLKIVWRFFPGGQKSQRFDYGASEITLNFKLRQFKSFPKIFFQYYHGYAESLISYNQRTTAYRIGLAL